MFGVHPTILWYDANYFCCPFYSILTVHFLTDHYHQLAKLSTPQDMYEDALELLDNAQRIAAKHEYRNELRSILCLMGIAHASNDFNQYSAELVEKSLSETNY